MIFSNVVVACANIPDTDKESILGAVMALGGQESKDAGKMTTHICALSMDHPKIEAAQAKKWKGKIVLPHWYALETAPAPSSQYAFLCANAKL